MDPKVNNFYSRGGWSDQSGTSHARPSMAESLNNGVRLESLELAISLCGRCIANRLSGSL